MLEQCVSSTLANARVCMAKEKTKGQKGPQQKHLHSRISYLYQAANYLANVQYSTQDSSTAAISSSASLQARRLVFDKSLENSESRGHVISSAAPDDAKELKVSREPTSQILAPSNSRRLINSLRCVSLKSQIRLTPEIKNSLCKQCDALLVPGMSSTHRFENLSKGGKKPSADVLVVTCNTCSTQKRFPVGANRQSKKSARTTKSVVTAPP